MSVWTFTRQTDAKVFTTTLLKKKKKKSAICLTLICAVKMFADFPYCNDRDTWMSNFVRLKTCRMKQPLILQKKLFPCSSRTQPG